ncbi:MAG: heterodisulfide reductase subunit C/nitrate reductase gamma subunit [Desulforhopalus sp.]|jgi:heterodisulfide reductase subunit C/nitrate reductase gamma subunit
MNFNILLSFSIIVCLLGLVFQFSKWFGSGISPLPLPTIGTRITTGIKALFATLLSGKIVSVIQSFFVDIIFQKRIFDKSLLRWTTHTLIFTGFLLLFIFHALSATISESLFADFQPTLNPFLFLRNLFGLMVIIGLGLATYRRISQKSKRLKSAPADWAALIFVAGIIFSGVLLEATKMSSYSTYMDMVDEYGSLDEEEGKALEAYWVQENGLVSPNFKSAPPAEMVTSGKEINGDSCIECHVSNKNGFVSYSVASVLGPVLAFGSGAAQVTLFYYLHIFTCLAFLCWIPFSKMFHMVSAPINLVIKNVTKDQYSGAGNSLNSQMIGLSACTHCGSCSVECSSSMFYESFDNDFILPSEKVQYLKKIAANQITDPEIIKKLQEGLYVCTSCDRCTTICPSGINLKELFINARYSLLKDGPPETTLLSHFSFPLALANNFVDDHIAALKKVTELFKSTFTSLSEKETPLTIGATDQFKDNTSFSSCYSCQRCTNICPVVRSYDEPVKDLGLLPHQIIYSLGIGDLDLALSSQMIWSCSTCYLCQEHCPNDVELCDIFYGLKNKAIQSIKTGANS